MKDEWEGLERPQEQRSKSIFSDPVAINMITNPGFWEDWQAATAGSAPSGSPAPGGVPMLGGSDKIPGAIYGGTYSPTAPGIATAPGFGDLTPMATAGSGGLASTGGGVTGFLGNMARRLDPNMLLLGGLSLLGGGDGGQERRSFREPGSISDPVQALWQALSATYRLGQGLSERGPIRLRSAVVPEGPAPISVPGLPFQIGGGMGRDPALKDPSLLERDMSWLTKYDPFQSIAQQQFSGTQGQAMPRARRRAPGGSNG